MIVCVDNFFFFFGGGGKCFHNMSMGSIIVMQLFENFYRKQSTDFFYMITAMFAVDKPT